MASKFCDQALRTAWPASILRLLLIIGLEPMLLVSSKNCDWYGHGVSFTTSPYKFNLDSNCTTLELPIRFFGAMRADGAKALAVALETVSNLKRIALDYNNIGDEGTVALASAFQHITSIAALDLKGNSIGDLGAKALSSELWHAAQLTRLDLQSNVIGPSGTRALAAALRKTPMMTFLSLAGNPIGDAGAKALASVLRHMPSLIGLDVSNCGLGEDGERSLAAAIVVLEAGRGGNQMQDVQGISEASLKDAREKRPAPPPDIVEAKLSEIQSQPMWKFLKDQCKAEGLDPIVVAMLAALGIQEVGDLNLWSNIEIERNLKRSGMNATQITSLQKCVDEEVRGKVNAPRVHHDEEL